MNAKKISLVVLLALSTLCATATIRPVNLRCEYLHNPLGVDATAPRLSWELIDSEEGKRGQIQSSYQVLVASSPEKLRRDTADLWDSGRVTSDAMNQIAYQGKSLSARERCFWKVKVWDGRLRSSGWSGTEFWTEGLLSPEEWHGSWISLDVPNSGSTGLAVPRYFRRGFEVHPKFRRATLYATALGLYELHLNGHKVGDHILAPEWTDYNKRVQYQTYDVTSQLHEGMNAMGAILGNGWYCGDWQHWESKLRPIYGTQPFLKLQLEIEDADGSIHTVGSGRAWRGTAEGPLRFSGIYEGETYDARKTLKGWDLPGFDDRKWDRAKINDPKVGLLTWQRSDPIRITQDLAPISVKEPKPGTYVFDLGQNIAGWCRIRLREAKNTEVTMKFNEMLNPDGTVYMDNLHAGHLSTGDRQVDRYICSGSGEEFFEPHFTYHGFRYVEVTGVKSKPKLDSLVGRVFHTSFEKTGSFSCSNPQLNRLAENIQWSQRANMMGIPTDCPQRDERCGYTGDAEFFMPTAVYNFDVAPFFGKWLNDVDDAQLADGTFPDHAPTFGPGDHWNVGWSDAGVICPYFIWKTYGDIQIIRDHYAAMKKNLALLKATSPTFLHTAKIGNGDWLNLGGGASDEVIGTAYDGYDFRLMAEMAAAIGESQDSKDFNDQAQKIADAFSKAYIGADGKIKDSSQTGYALAFTMGLVPEKIRSNVTDRFGEEMKRFDMHLATGFIGTPRLLPALHEAGRDDLAYRVLLQKSYPSWLYQVGLGATTMWERWDGWRPEKGFQDSGMNSFNHYAFGSVGAYLFGAVGGISASEAGFRKVRIQPAIGKGLNWATVSYRSIRGELKSAWKREAKRFSLQVEVPPNTKAEVFMPAEKLSSVEESGKQAARAVGVKFLRAEGRSLVFEVGSGIYRFSVPSPATQRRVP